MGRFIGSDANRQTDNRSRSEGSGGPSYKPRFADSRSIGTFYEIGHDEHGLSCEMASLMASAPYSVTISVAICTRDRPTSLARCIQAVLSQNVKPTEIIIVDDGELPESTQLEFARASRQSGVAWRYIRKTQPGLTRSRNLALSLSCCEVVQFLDDDAEPGMIS